jgi:hypothetical protein
MAEIVRVETKSAWLSKINWTQAVGLTASVLVFATGGKIDIPLEQQTEVVLAIQALQGLVTWALKTWWTPTITPAAAGVAGLGLKTMKLD